MINQFFNKTIYNKPRDLFLVVCCIFSIFFSSCGKEKFGKTDKTLDIEATKVDKADSVTLIMSQDGIVKARLLTKEFIQNDVAKPPYLDIKKGLTVYFYNDSGIVESTLTADHARYYQKTNNILVEKNVIVENEKGEKLYTEQLIWNSKIDRFYTQMPIKILGNGQETYGTGLEANRNFTWFRIFKQTGKIPIKEDQLPN